MKFCQNWLNFTLIDGKNVQKLANACQIPTLIGRVSGWAMPDFQQQKLLQFKPSRTNEPTNFEFTCEILEFNVRQGPALLFVYMKFKITISF